MPEPKTRRRRAEVAATSKQPAPAQLPPTAFCPHCGYQYGEMGDVEKTSAELALTTGIKMECPDCDHEATPVLEKPKRSVIEPPQIAASVRSIIESVFKIDLGSEWFRLKDNLEVGDGRTDHGTVTMALDKAQDNALDAHKLYVNMEIEYERYKIDRKVIWSTLRDEAHSILQSEKKDGERSKMITDGDVEAKMAELHPDEFKHVELEKKKFELSVEHAKNFADRWAKKATDLNTILAKMRG